MKRVEFENTIRAAGAVLGVNEVLVIGSQALHASVPGDLPGEASMFHETFGYYAEGVVSSTAVLPGGWRERLVRFETPATAGVVAWCLEVHDLWLSKAVAGRPKDLEFCAALKRTGLVRAAVLEERLPSIAVDDRLRPVVAARIRSL